MEISVNPAEFIMDSSEKEEPTSDGFKLEVKDPLGEGPMEIAISPSIEHEEDGESGNWEQTEEETTK